MFYAWNFKSHILPPCDAEGGIGFLIFPKLVEVNRMGFKGVSDDGIGILIEFAVGKLEKQINTGFQTYICFREHGFQKIELKFSLRKIGFGTGIFEEGLFEYKNDFSGLTCSNRCIS